MRHARKLALVTVLAAALAGCGSASQGGGSGENGAAAVPSPVLAAQSSSGAGSDYIVKSNDTIYEGKPPQIVSYPTGRDNDEVSETGAAPIEPCSFVSGDQASAILGGPVEIEQQPQGPTCVYSVRGSDRQVTLVIESIRIAGLRGRARSASPVQVAGNSAWCLRYDDASVVVPLPSGAVLHVTGPCAEAARFAALALPNVPG